jgi:hypothetical protein
VVDDVLSYEPVQRPPGPPSLVVFVTPLLNAIGLLLNTLGHVYLLGTVACCIGWTALPYLVGGVLGLIVVEVNRAANVRAALIATVLHLVVGGFFWFELWRTPYLGMEAAMFVMPLVQCIVLMTTYALLARN